MRRFRLIIPLLVAGLLVAASPPTATAVVVIFSESFETDGQGTRYTASQPFNKKNNDDAWDRGEVNDFSSLVPHVNPDGTFFWYAEDVNAENPGGNGNDVQTIDFATINIASFINLVFSGQFASTANEFFGPGFPFHEPDDGIKVRYSIDSGPYQDGLCFARDSNSNMQLDIGCDGSGEGGLLTANLAGPSNPYKFSIPNGSTLDLRIEVKADEASEELAFDNFLVMGDEVVDVGLPGPPAKTFLSAAAPNPFQGQTTIRLGLAVAGDVRLSVYDVRGRLTRVLLSGEHAAGHKSLIWDGRDQAGVPAVSGNYIIQLKSEQGVFTKRVSLIR